MRQGRWGSLCLATTVALAACAEAPTTNPTPRPRPNVNGGPLTTASAVPGGGFGAVDRSPAPVVPSPSPTVKASVKPDTPASTTTTTTTSPTPDTTATATPTPTPTPTTPVADPNASTGVGVGSFTVSKLVGSTPGATEGTESQALFNNPVAMALDLTVQGGQRFYVADAGNFKIRRVLVSETGNITVDTYAGTGVEGDADASSANLATFRNLKALACANNGDLFVVDGHRVRRILANGSEVTTIAGGDAGKVPANSGDAAIPASQVRFQNPVALAATSSNTLLVADTGNHRIDEISLGEAGFPTSVLAGTGSAGYSNGESRAAAMDSPCALSVDVNGVIYFADRNHRIRNITTDFQVSLIGGDASTTAGAGAMGEADGTVAVTGSPTGRFNFTLGAGLFSEPSSPGSLYVAETSTHRIRLVHQGQLKTLAGANASGATEGVGTAARFNLPSALTMKERRMVVLDSGNHRMRLVLP